MSLDHSEKEGVWNSEERVSFEETCDEGMRDVCMITFHNLFHSEVADAELAGRFYSLCFLGEKVVGKSRVAH